MRLIKFIFISLNFPLHYSEFVPEPDANCIDYDIRLVNGSTVDPLEGRVEVCINNAWGTICDTGFGINDAEVICRLLGHPFSGMYLYVCMYMYLDM